MSNYDDIINLPHHVSKKHPQMSIHDRAAQFSPFAALSGHEEAIDETARLTDMEIDYDEDVRLKLDLVFFRLREEGFSNKKCTITYFLKDSKKQGGAYLTVTDFIKKFDEYHRILKLQNGTEIPLKNITKIELI